MPTREREPQAIRSDDDPPAGEASGERAERPETNPIVALSFLPLIVFWVLTRVVDSQIAIGAAFGVAIVVFWMTRRRQRGVVAWLAILGLVVVSGSAIAGLVLDSEKAYLASDPVGDFVTVLIALGSLAIGRPIIGAVVCELMPGFSRGLRSVDRVFVQLTALLVVKELATGIARVFLLDELSTDGYLLFSRVVSWPLNGVYLYVAYILIVRARRSRLRARVLTDTA